MTDKTGKNSDTWLSDEATVSRAYDELTSAMPPAHLDQAILAEARRAAASQDHTVIRVQRWRKWTMPAALAATVVFAVPLVVRVFDSAPPTFDSDGSPAVTRTNETAAEYRSDEQPEKTLVYPYARELTANDNFHQQALTTAPAKPPVPEPQELEWSRPELEVLPAEDLLRQAAEEDSALIAVGMRSRGFGIDGKTSSATVSADTPDSAPIATGDVVAASPARQDFEKPEAALGRQQRELRYSNAAEPGLASAADPRAERERKADTAISSERNRALSSEFDSSVAGLAVDDSSASMPMTVAVAEPQQSASVDEGFVDAGSYLGKSSRQKLDPEQWLDAIATQHQLGQLRNARRSLAYFLTAYPGHELPDDFPLQAEDALFDTNSNDNPVEIVPEAASWLRGIGMMAERGDIDQARTQLAEFVRIFPDYPLPADFPLTREDALPIER